MGVDNSEDSDVDDDVLHETAQVHGFMTSSHNPFEEPLEVKAHFLYTDSWYNSKGRTSKIFAISDGGADSCFVGKYAKVLEYTGRYANLVGYDPGTTRMEKVPIVTALIKVKSSTKEQYPILLKINETPFNANSPVTLLSEYQIREYGLVIDSVAKKHKTAHNQFGTQRFQVNSHVHIDFEDRGALMGFEILPIMEGDEEIYDVITITSPEQWRPRIYKDTNLTLHGANCPDPPGISCSD